jgi:hypothetical protein
MSSVSYIQDEVTTQLTNRETRPLATSLTAHAAQQAFSDAGNQFTALTTATFHPDAIFPTLHDGRLTIEIQKDGRFADAQSYLSAVKAIEAKASSLGYGPQGLAGDVASVSGGYLGRYTSHDIYAAPGGAAFEVHGDIRAKYNALGGADGLLGIPETDERGTPDGIGRFNHFKGGSIYWTPRTGPMAVRGAVRDFWASTGWERGPFGYPVQDQHRMIPMPATDPIVEWCRFENGVIAGDPKGAKGAPVADLSYAELGALFGARMAAQFSASPDNVALRPGIELTGVTDWQYNFWWSISRSVGFRLRGFRDNGLLPDTDFSIDIGLRFELVWGQTFTEPTFKTLVAVLEFLRVRHEGQDDQIIPILPGEVIKGVTKAIGESFFPAVWPDPAHPDVPMGAIHVADVPTGANLRTGVIDILDVLVSAAGDLQILVNPLAPPKQAPGFNFDWGHERQRQAQDRIDSL